VKFFRSKSGVALLAIVLIVLFLFRPGVFGLRNRISSSIGNALGRRVTLDNVRLHALPRPGFDLEGLVIYDDPAFSAEPMIRAQDVFAAIRLSSLLRGRIEIATLSATEPSINLVRASNGRWNLATLIERNSRIPVAPTQKAPSERRPAFPYLQATSARINFKAGPEKKSYALTNADVALWQDSENSWGARLKAQPVRTDFNLNDTGQLQINAEWQRAPDLRQTPLRVTMTWQKGQLGQITQLLTGKDRGWRGGLDFAANLEGTPEALTIDSQASIQGFRRYDIVDKRSVRLATHCTGHYQASTGVLNDLACESPSGGGTVKLSGNLATKAVPRNYTLTLQVKDVQAASLVALAHQAKQQLPADLTGEGLLNAEFHATRAGSEPAQFTGSGEATDFLLKANEGSDSIALGNIPLTLVSLSCCGGEQAPKAARGKKPAPEITLEPKDPYLRVGPAKLAVNDAAPLDSTGMLSLQGYAFTVRGDLGLKNVFVLEKALGVPALQPAAEGSAKLAMTISGQWRGLLPPDALGTAQLKNVRAETRGLNTPIEIASATVTLSPALTTIDKLSARTGDTHWSGSVRLPRHCAPNCQYEFDLVADRLSPTDLAEWFTPHPSKHPWYRILSSNSDDQAGPSPLLAAQAHGRLRVAQLAIGKALATQVSTDFAADHGKITLTHLQAQFLQGQHLGDWTIDASVHPPEYHGTGTLQDISLDRLSTLMNDAWITGIANGTFDVRTTGISSHDLLTNADGKLQFSMRNGSFAHVEIPGAPAPFPVSRFSGGLRVKDGKWQLSAGKLQSRDGLYMLTGTSSLGALDFTLTRGNERSWNLTGTLAKPLVEPASEEISRRDPKPEATTKP